MAKGAGGWANINREILRVQTARADKAVRLEHALPLVVPYAPKSGAARPGGERTTPGSLQVWILHARPVKARCHASVTPRNEPHVDTNPPARTGRKNANGGPSVTSVALRTRDTTNPPLNDDE